VSSWKQFEPGRYTETGTGLSRLTDDETRHRAEPPGAGPLELCDALARIDGTAGLVIFSDEPYAVTPLTDDPRVIAKQVPLLEPELMPGRGDRVDRAIDEARTLIERAGAIRGRIVLLIDGVGERPDLARSAATRAADAGYPVSVSRPRRPKRRRWQTSASTSIGPSAIWSPSAPRTRRPTPSARQRSTS